MQEIYKNIEQGKYKNTLACGSKVEERLEWGKNENRLSEIFYQDICHEAGLNPDSKKANLIWTKAWAHGHGSGYSEILHYFEEFLDFATELKKYGY